MPSPERETWVVGPYSTNAAPRLVCVRSTEASMSITGVPEIRRSVLSRGERNTRRLVC